jgi:serine/threonine protein kinase/tetratricopeptide (TPR) repeat protein
LTAGQWREVEQLLQEAQQLVSADRERFVAAIADAQVRLEVASLLAAEGKRSTLDIRAAISTAARTLEEAPLGSVLGHFRVLREIGRGGMGVVLLAEDLKLGRQVALKLLPAAFHLDSDRVRRFEREARAAAALNHPNIVTVFEVGEWEGKSFIATELVEGETLEERLSRSKLPVGEAVQVGGQILAAMAAAHAAGIIHRDLKPANIMLRADGTVKVLDFGLARLVQPAATPNTRNETITRTALGRVMGTPAYMAPEQWEGMPADARTDIYSFGCILVEMLTGGRAGPQRKRLPSRAMERIVSRCLEPSPARRLQSAHELMLQLLRVNRRRRYWREIGIAAAGVALALGVAIWWSRHARARRLTDKDVLVLSDFTNTTGDPVFDGTLRQGLAIQMEQSPFLKIMDDVQMRQDLRLMGRSPAERITSQIAHDICVRDAAAATIEGSIASLGKAYVLTLQAVTCTDGVTLAREQSQAEDKEHVLEAVDKAATSMRAKLGESLAAMQKLNSPLGQFTTSSLEALQQYALGYTPQSQGQFLASIPFFQRAVELDPSFAWAYQGLSLAYSNAGDLARSREFQIKAFELSDRVSEFERLFIRGRYYWQATGELDKAIGVYRAIIGSYPRYWGARSELSLLYKSMAEFEKALEESQEAVRLEPRVEPAHRNLVRAYIALDRLVEAKAALAQARALHFDGSRLHQRVLEIAYLEGAEATVASETQWYKGKPEEYISFGLQAANADVSGRRREAASLYRRAADTALRRDLRNVAAEYEDADALADALCGNCAAVRRRGRPALALALCGEAAAAGKLAGEVSAKGTIWNAVQLPAIRAAMELRRGQPAKAIELLAPAVPYERAFPEVHYLRGQAYLSLGKGSEAAAEFQQILQHKGANWGPFYALSYPGLALGLVLAGDAARAGQSYQDFFALWKNADSGSAVLSQSRKEFAAITRQK